MAYVVSADGGGGNGGGGTINVDASVVNSTANTYKYKDADLETMRTGCDTIDSDISDWKGSTADAARVLNQRMIECIDSIRQAVSDEAEKLAQAQSTFATTDSYAASSYSATGGN
ncbi:MAG: WXG100 family type VII secretion target [Coriobacteriales bacterium]|jgi:hypothetical protein